MTHRGVSGAGIGLSGSGRVPVSLVVAVRDEELSLDNLIAGIEGQSAAPEEVIFVDGGSSDRTVEVASRQATLDPRYLVLQAEGAATPGRGRNIGICAARHDWIALTDAGVRLEPLWLERLWAAHQARPGAGIVYGNFEFDTRSLFEECAAVAGGSPKTWDTPAGRIRRPAVVSCLVHRDTVEAVGGFPDLRAGEDMIFAQRVDQLAIETAWAPDATVWWRLRPDFTSTFERSRLYSYHNALAGQQPYWHHRMARNWLPVGGALVLGSIHSKRWLLLGATTVLARVGLKISRHADGRGWRWGLRPGRAILITTLVVTNDVAAALGWWQASRTSSSRSAASSHGANSGG